MAKFKIRKSDSETDSAAAFERASKTRADFGIETLADDEELSAAAREFREAVTSPEAQRGLEAFRGKRPLTWGD